MIRREKYNGMPADWHACRLGIQATVEIFADSPNTKFTRELWRASLKGRLRSWTRYLAGVENK